MTITQQNFYSYVRGNYAISEIILRNEGWKVLSATVNTYVQYASVYDNDTGDKVVLHMPSLTEALDISNIKNLRLRLQSKEAESVTAQIIWTLK